MQQANRNRIAGVKGRTLRNITDPGLFASLPGLGEGNNAVVFPLSQNRFQKCGFAGTVGTNEGHHLTAVDVQIYIFQDAVGANLYRQIFHPQAAGVTAAAAVNIKFHPSASFRVSMLWYMASK